MNIEREIIKHHADLNDKEWKLEVNTVSWNRGEPKLDIRQWSPDHEKCDKGITLTEIEARRLKRVLNELMK